MPAAFGHSEACTGEQAARAARLPLSTVRLGKQPGRRRSMCFEWR